MDGPVIRLARTEARYTVRGDKKIIDLLNKQLTN